MLAADSDRNRSKGGRNIHLAIKQKISPSMYLRVATAGAAGLG